jgi:hypothetical protein
MATITEDYVSFKTSKLLKEKGFDEPIQYFYKFDSKKLYRGTVFTNTQIGDKCYNAPTLQMTMKWLREVHNIHIIAHPYTDMKGNNWSFIFDKYAYDCWQELGIYITDSWNSYEEACEVAIKYCLENLI